MLYVDQVLSSKEILHSRTIQAGLATRSIPEVAPDLEQRFSRGTDSPSFVQSLSPAQLLVISARGVDIEFGPVTRLAFV